VLNKVLIADDHSLVRNGLMQIVHEISKDAAIIEAATGDQTIEALNSNSDLDLILFDLAMPETDGVSTLRVLTANPLAIPVVVVSASDSYHDIQSAFDAGALGYIHKSESSAVMSAAIHLVLSGGLYVPPCYTHYSPGSDKAAVFSTLTRRQKEVLCLILKGHTNRQIAEQLGLNEVTVKAHVGAMLKHLGVDSRTKVVIMAKECRYRA